LALKLASKSLDFLINFKQNHDNDCENNAVVIGMRKKQIMTTTIKELKGETDFEYVFY
jgi:hypothetical protein